MSRDLVAVFVDATEQPVHRPKRVRGYPIRTGGCPHPTHHNRGGRVSRGKSAPPVPSPLPTWQIPADFGLQKPRPGAFGQLLPAYYKVMTAKVRLHQSVALLMVAEGVRAHAADNAGKLPVALDAVKLPLPVDPVTGKPFGYEVKDGTASIRGTPAPGREKEPSFNRVYEVTVRK